MNKFYKTKKIISVCVILAMIMTLSLTLYSCEKPDIYVLVENILLNKNLDSNAVYSFDAVMNIKINDDIKSDSIPDEIKFIIDGTVKNSTDNINQFEINITIPFTNGVEDEETEEESYLKTTLYKSDNLLYIELNDVSRVILDLLNSTYLIDEPIKILFDNMVEYDNDSVICFDLTGLDLSIFDEYIETINNAFTVESSVNYISDIKDFELKEYDAEKIIYFNDIKKQINKKLLSLPNYRYSELYIILETDENNDNYINILATRENYETEILEKVKIDCDLSKARENHDELIGANIIPMRYVMELLGETVGWDDSIKQAYIEKEDKNIYFEKSLVNSTTYISLLQILAKTSYKVQVMSADEFIEFKISR